MKKLFILGALALASCGGESNQPAAPVAAPPVVLPANNPPTIVMNSVEVAENFNEAVGTAVASDPDGDRLILTLEGEDAAQFTVDGTGAVRFGTPPDYENPSDANSDNVYLLSVVATDPRGLSAKVEFTVKVTNIGAARFVAGIQYSDITPTVEFPVAMGRIATDRWLVRTLSVEGGSPLDFDEFEMRDPAGVAVDRGLQLTGHKAMVRHEYRVWTATPDFIGHGSTQEFAWRMGREGDEYVSGGDDGDFAYAGFGHGRMRWKESGRAGGSSIILDGAAPDRSSVPVGSIIFGDKIDVLQNYELAVPDGEYVADVVMVHSFSSNGLQENVSIDVNAEGIVGNDSYLTMYPFRGDVVKPVGLASYLAKTAAREIFPWGNSSMRDVQFYYDSDRTVMVLLSLDYGAPLRREGLAPYALNSGRRFFLTWHEGVTKFYGFAMSSVGQPPSALRLKGRYDNLLSIRTVIRDGGPR